MIYQYIMTQILHIQRAHELYNGVYNLGGYTEYKHTNGPVTWGDPVYQSVTDCSGWINALLMKSYNWNREQLKNIIGSTRPYARTYYNAIVNNHNFNSYYNINEARIGDFISILFPPGSTKSDNTGHIVMINQLPQLIKNQSPFNEFIQYEVQIMDQSGHHGSNDSRYRPDNKSFTGLGIGYIRIYTDNFGNLKGYTWSLEANSQFISIDKRPFVIGRLL